MESEQVDEEEEDQEVEECPETPALHPKLASDLENLRSYMLPIHVHTETLDSTNEMHVIIPISTSRIHRVFRLWQLVRREPLMVKLTLDRKSYMSGNTAGKVQVYQRSWSLSIIFGHLVRIIEKFCRKHLAHLDNFLCELVMYVELRLANLHEFCPLCDNKHVVCADNMRSVVCSRPLCNLFVHQSPFSCFTTVPGTSSAIRASSVGPRALDIGATALGASSVRADGEGRDHSVISLRAPISRDVYARNRSRPAYSSLVAAARSIQAFLYTPGVRTRNSPACSTPGDDTPRNLQALYPTVSAPVRNHPAVTRNLEAFHPLHVGHVTPSAINHPAHLAIGHCSGNVLWKPRDTIYKYSSYMYGRLPHRLPLDLVSLTDQQQFKHTMAFTFQMALGIAFTDPH